MWCQGSGLGLAAGWRHFFGLHVNDGVLLRRRGAAGLRCLDVRVVGLGVGRAETAHGVHAVQGGVYVLEHAVLLQVLNGVDQVVEPRCAVLGVGAQALGHGVEGFLVAASHFGWRIKQATGQGRAGVLQPVLGGAHAVEVAFEPGDGGDVGLVVLGHGVLAFCGVGSALAVGQNGFQWGMHNRVHRCCGGIVEVVHASFVFSVNGAGCAQGNFGPLLVKFTAGK